VLVIYLFLFLLVLFLGVQVAERTEKVYDHTLRCKLPYLRNRMDKLLDCGIVIGKIFVLFVVLDVILLKILDYYQPFNSREKKLKKLKIK